MLGSAMKTLLYGVSPRDGMSFVVAAAVLLTMTVIASFVPGLRATRVDHADVLRSE
jgi:ABC-type lipoprotein release transport system permease subunit